MIYENIVEGVFLERPNRFIAEVLINQTVEKVHVKNTGRCKELLIKGSKVYLEKSDNPNRKTKYSLISVYKEDLIVNIDSQVPNKVVYDALLNQKVREIQNITLLKREVTYKKSRFDLYFETAEGKGFIEVKGVTLEKNHIAKFPDAPTSRGTKHINEMIDAVENNYSGYIFFLIQLARCQQFTPNYETDQIFGEALKKANEKGVEILCYDSYVSKNEIIINQKIPILL